MMDMMVRKMISAAAAGLCVLAVSCSVEPLGESAGVEAAEPSAKIINRRTDPVEGSLIVRLSDLSQYFSLEQRLRESGIGIEPVFTGLTAAVTKAGTGMNSGSASPLILTVLPMSLPDMRKSAGCSSTTG